jgi:hypothetical protein
VALALAGRAEPARSASEEAARLADRLHYPVAGAATAEAAGACAEDARAGVEKLEEATAAWEELGRPVDAARCRALRGRRLMDAGADDASAALEEAAAAYEQVGLEGLAGRTREQVT